MKLEEVKPDLLAGAEIRTAQVAVCDTLKQADNIRNALDVLKRFAAEPEVYIFAARKYFVLVLGDVITGGTDVQNTNP